MPTPTPEFLTRDEYCPLIFDTTDSLVMQCQDHPKRGDGTHGWYRHPSKDPKNDPKLKIDVSDELSWKCCMKCSVLSNYYSCVQFTGCEWADILGVGCSRDKTCSCMTPSEMKKKQIEFNALNEVGREDRRKERDAQKQIVKNNSEQK